MGRRLSRCRRRGCIRLRWGLPVTRLAFRKLLCRFLSEALSGLFRLCLSGFRIGGSELLRRGIIDG
jgi:hypothetical protein